MVRTKGNTWGHLVLRGGASGPNYHPECIEAATDLLERAGLDPVVIVDCSRDNSGKRQERQAEVVRKVLLQRIEGQERIVGVMIESNLAAGNQQIPADLAALRHGVSITDECMSWETTERLLREAADKFADRLTAVA